MRDVIYFTESIENKTFFLAFMESLFKKNH